MSLRIRKAVECFKLGLMGYTSRNMKDSGAEGDLNCKSPVQEVSEKYINTRSRDCSCDILSKNVAVFFFFKSSKSLPEAEEFWINYIGKGNLKTA